FEQVGGLYHARQELVQELILPLTNPQLSSLYNRSTNPKVFLYGPASCGKSHLCKALATESEIAFIPIRPVDFIDLTFEEAEFKLMQMVSVARETKPAIFIVDEVSWLAEKSAEGQVAEDYERRLLMHSILKILLELLNGRYTMNSQIGLVVTSNQPWNLEQSFFESTKIDKHIFVSPPTHQEKIEILEAVINSKQSPIVQLQNVDAESVINLVGKILYTPADIEELVENTLSRLMLNQVAMLKTSVKERSQLLTTEKLIETATQLRTSNASLKNWFTNASKLKGSYLEVLLPSIFSPRQYNKPFSWVSTAAKMISAKIKQRLKTFKKK
ncbi:MAG TPA: ATP-binding protein, partial [Vampirovibrionales bacterium]